MLVLVRHEWKRTYLGVLDAEGGLYLNGSDLAKIGYLYLHDGMWDGQRIVSSAWVKESVTPYLQTPAEPEYKDGLEGRTACASPLTYDRVHRVLTTGQDA